MLFCCSFCYFMFVIIMFFIMLLQGRGIYVGIIARKEVPRVERLQRGADRRQGASREIPKRRGLRE